jgi:hypothetical protein
MQLFYAESRGLDPASARSLLLEGFVMGLWETATSADAIGEAARAALHEIVLPVGAADGEGNRSAQLSGGGAGPSVSPLTRPATSPSLRDKEENG